MFSDFIVFACRGDGFYDVAYSDLLNRKDVKYYNHPMKSIRSFFLRLLGKLVFRPSFNAFFPRWVEIAIYHAILKGVDDNAGKHCFVIFYPTYFYLKDGFVSAIRKRFTNSKIVLYFQDIISSYRGLDKQISFIKDRFDVVLSYDKDDSSKYGFTYYPTPFSIISVNDINSVSECDVYYCGKAKSRYPLIFQAYKSCQERGLKCNFFIFGLKKEYQIKAPGLHYDTPVNYIQNLRYVNRTKCILEIMQEGATGYTPRLWESIVFDKHLLTNNESIINSKYYNFNSIHLIDSDMCSIQEWINLNVNYNNSIKRELSPIYLLSFLNELFSD